jgi:signal transduction histidine kinase
MTKGKRGRVEAAFATSKAARILMDQEGKVMMMNPAAEALFGVKAADATNRSCAQLASSQKRRDWLDANRAEAMASGATLSSCDRGDYAQAPWTGIFSPMTLPEGQAGMEVIIIEGPGEPEVAEEGGAAIFQHLLFRTSGMHIMLEGPDLRLRFANHLARKVLGLSPGDPLGRSLEELLGALPEELLAVFRKVRDSHELAMRIGHFLGQSPWHGTCFLRLLVIPVPGSAQDFDLSCTVQDVTEREEERYLSFVNAIQEERRRLRGILDTLPMGIEVRFRDSEEREANFHTARIWRVRRPEDLPLDLAAYSGRFASTGRPVGQDEWPISRALLKGEEVMGEELQIDRFDGTTGHILASGAPFFDQKGKVIGAITALIDVSEHRGMEQIMQRQSQELARSNEALRQYAYVASHDLQEPLRMVVNFIALLERSMGEQLDDRSKDYMRYIVEGASRMQRLIDDLLTYSRLDASTPVFDEVDLGRVTDTALANLNEAIEASEARIRIGELPTVTGDENQLTQLMQNLLANAIKFHRRDQRPEVEVRAELQGNEWRISVQDNGIGIAQQDRVRLFEMFHRLNSRDDYPGTGIGLAISRKVVERHGGRIDLESTPGEGTIFFFTLPIAAQGSEPMEEDIDPPDS